MVRRYAQAATWPAVCCGVLRLDRLMDLASRWQRARRAAQTVAVADGAPGEAATTDAVDASAQRRGFDNSLRLGEGFRRHHAPVRLADLPFVLEQLAPTAPCLAGTWTPRPEDEALTLERTGCPAAGDGPAVCDWWREAIAGLVLGVTGDVRHDRHCSRGHGGARCVDVFYRDPQSPLRFGPIPDAMRGDLDAVARSVAILDSACVIEFLGLSEDVLYYRLPTAVAGGGVRGQPLVERSLRRRFPHLSPREVTPRPVFVET